MTLNPSRELTDAEIREQAAFHEAGHAVMAHIAGFPLEEVSIKGMAVENGYVRGIVTLRPFKISFLSTSRGRPGQTKILDLIAIYCAGEVGAALCGQPPENLIPGGAGDMEEVGEFCKLLNIDDQKRESLLELAWLLAEQTLCKTPKNEVAVHILAKMLLKCETLSPKEVRLVIQHARRAYTTNKQRGTSNGGAEQHPSASGDQSGT